MNKMVFAIMAIVFAGMVVLPYTVSLLAGEHCWYNLSSRGNDVPCEKCHADVKEEMEQLVGPHTNETGYGRMKCEYCHRVFPITHKNASFETYTYASGDGTGAQPGKEAHAASTVPCMYCHSGDKSGVRHTNAVGFNCYTCHSGVHGGRYTNREDCIRCHGNAATGHIYYIPPAGGFSLTTNSTDTGEKAAHITFVMGAIENNTLEGANEACIACHTRERVEMNFNVTTELNITVNNSYTHSSSFWNVTGMKVSNYTTYKEVKEG